MTLRTSSSRGCSARLGSARTEVDPVDLEPEWTVDAVADHQAHTVGQVLAEGQVVDGSTEDRREESVEGHRARLPLPGRFELDRSPMRNPTIAGGEVVVEGDHVGAIVGPGPKHDAITADERLRFERQPHRREAPSVGVDLPLEHHGPPVEGQPAEGPAPHHVVVDHQPPAVRIIRLEVGETAASRPLDSIFSWHLGVLRFGGGLDRTLGSGGRADVAVRVAGLGPR